MKKNNIISMAVLAMFAFTSCCNEPQVKNVIYLIGDGMGFGAVSTLLLSEDEQTGFEMAPVIGIHETCSANNYVTDSAAGGTALATGTRTNNGYVGADPDGNQLTSVLRKAQTYGMKTGIVVNTTLTEATPGAFYGGVTSRKFVYDIAKQFTESEVDLAIGGGLDHFVGRPDSLDLTATLIEKGYDVYLNWETVLETESDKFVGILPLYDLHRREENNGTASAAEGQEVCLAAQMAALNEDASREHLSEPTVYLEKATAKALDVLSRNNKNGFFLMIEGSCIDDWCHANKVGYAVEEILDFDRTVGLVLEWAAKDGETLVIVTADHSTGAMTLCGGKVEEQRVAVNFANTGHNGVALPVYAWGPRAEEFVGIYENAELSNKIKALIK